MRYEDLPGAIQAMVSEYQFLCLSDEEKLNLEHDMTTPDYEEDHAE